MEGDVNTARHGRMAFGVSAGFLVLLLAACSTDDINKNRVETFEVRRTRVGDGPATTTRSHTVDYEKIERVPEQDIAGFWVLSDNFDRQCLIDLKISGGGESTRTAESTRECDNGMRNLAVWRFVDEVEPRIEIFDAGGKLIGSFTQNTERDYSGTFSLTTEQVVNARIVKFSE